MSAIGRPLPVTIPRATPLAASPSVTPARHQQTPSTGGGTATPMQAAAAATPATAAAASLPFGVDFGSSSFDLKEFINQQVDLAAQGKEDTAGARKDGPSDLSATTSHLSSLLMHLQLLSADLHSTMETQSVELVQAMPKAMREMAFIQRESQSLRANLSDILKDMTTIEHGKPSATAASIISVPITPIVPIAASPASPGVAGAASPTPSPSASTTIDFLHSIDSVKSRITRCVGTLEEVEKWTKRERTVEMLLERVGAGSAATTTAGKDGAATFDISVLPQATDSAYTDLYRIHTELASMRTIVERFRTIGVDASREESEARQENLKAYGQKRDRVAELLLEQLLDSLAANASADADANTSVSASVAKHLRILRDVYGEANARAFQSAYQTGKVKQSLVKQVLDRYVASSMKKAPQDGATAPAPSTAAAPMLYDPKQLDQWLPKFFDSVLQFARGEIAFAEHVFHGGEHHHHRHHSSTGGKAAADHPTASVGAPVGEEKNGGEREEKKQLFTEEGEAAARARSSSTSASSSAQSASFIYPSVLTVLSSEISPLLSTWFHTFFTAHKGSDAAGLLAGLWKVCVKDFGEKLAELMLHAQQQPPAGDVTPAADSSVSSLLLSLLLTPFAGHFLTWSLYEKKSLLASLDRMSFGGDSYEQLSRNIEEAHAIILHATQDAAARAREVEEGVLVEGTLTALGEYYTEVAQRLFSLLRRLRRIAGLDGVQPTPGEASSPSSALSAASKSKSPASSQGDGLTDLMRDASSSGAAASESAPSAELTFASFQGAFGLLKTARALQYDLFSPYAQDTLLASVVGAPIGGVGSTSAGLVQIVKQAELTLETAQGGLPSTRKNSLASSAAPVVGLTPAHGDLSKLLGVLFLTSHPKELKSLVHFLSAHYAPFHAAALASEAAHHAHGTQGLHAHGHVTPVGAQSVASPGTSRSGGVGGAVGAKYSFPSTPGGGFAVSNGAAAASSSSSSSSTSLFPSSSSLFDSFISALHNLILDTMFRPIQAKLGKFHEWSTIWQAKAGAGLLSSIPLPSFSLQPSEYMIQIGEHLLTLVQQMEPYVAKQEDDEDEDGASQVDLAAHAATLQAASLLPGAPIPSAYLEHDALYWLNLLSKGTFKHLLSSIHQLSSLSEKGAKQLACDLEYLVNVLAALGLAIPSTVLKLQVWLQWTETQAMHQLNQGLAGEDWRLEELAADERHMLRQVIKARRFKQIEATPALQTAIGLA